MQAPRIHWGCSKLSVAISIEMTAPIKHDNDISYGRCQRAAQNVKLRGSEDFRWTEKNVQCCEIFQALLRFRPGILSIAWFTDEVKVLFVWLCEFTKLDTERFSLIKMSFNFLLWAYLHLICGTTWPIPSWRKATSSKMLQRHMILVTSFFEAALFERKCGYLGQHTLVSPIFTLGSFLKEANRSTIFEIANLRIFETSSEKLTTSTSTRLSEYPEAWCDGCSCVYINEEDVYNEYFKVAILSLKEIFIVLMQFYQISVFSKCLMFEGNVQVSCVTLYMLQILLLFEFEQLKSCFNYILIFVHFCSYQDTYSVKMTKWKTTYSLYYGNCLRVTLMVKHNHCISLFGILLCNWKVISYPTNKSRCPLS